MGGRVAKGGIYYYIHWQVDDDNIASSPVVQLADVPPEGQVSIEAQLAFVECVKAYVADHNEVALPHAGTNGATWGFHAIFPLSDSQLLKLIAAATSENGSGAAR
jgi:hypothetical protein